MRATATVTVIVPVSNDPRVELCLSALEHQTYPWDRLEVLVVDNGPEPMTIRPRRVPLRVSVLRHPGGGAYEARNFAMSRGAGEVLAFTDADCIPEPTWVEAAVQALQAGAGVVAGRVRVFARDDARPHPIEAYELVHAFPQETYVRRGGACVTANLVTTRAAMDVVGPFRSALRSGADVDWARRAHRAGFRTAYCPSAEVRHPARDSYSAMAAKLRRVTEGRMQRDALDGSAPMAAPSLRSWVPPLGAFRRVGGAPELRTRRARFAFVIGELYVRYAGLFTYYRVRRSRAGSGDGGTTVPLTSA